MMQRFGGNSRWRWGLCVLIGISLLAACTPEAKTIVELPTATLQPIASQTARLTATPVPSNTPLPTFTFTPTDVPPSSTPTLSPTPTMTPTITGIVQSMQSINVREGPGVTYSGFTAIKPGTGVQIIGRDSTGEWLNIRLEDGREGWVSTKLMFIPPPPTEMPTMTPSPDLTSLALGTPLPTALRGGTITATPPAAISTATEIGAASPTTAPTTAMLDSLPEIPMNDINATRESLSRGAATVTPSITPTLLPTATPGRELTLAVPGTPIAPGSSTPATAAPTAADGTPNTTVNEGLTEDQVKALKGVDVFAFCDRTAYGIAKPTALTPGSTIDIYWAWFAREEAQVLQHVNAAKITLAVNGTPITDLTPYRTRIRQEGENFATYWYVPYGPLTAGEYKITYSVTWDRAITDGYAMFGPGTSTETEEESCTFTVK
jgi:hypothetical protein